MRILYPGVLLLSIPIGYLLAGIEQLIIARMDKYEIRRQKVEELIRDRCDGVYAKFADKIERNPSYVGRMLYPEGKPGKKNISDTLIDVIEKKFNLPRGWLDGIAENQADTVKPPELIGEASDEEKQLLEAIRKLDSETKTALLKITSLLPAGDKKIGGRRLGGERRQRENTVKEERRQNQLTNKGGR